VDKFPPEEEDDFVILGAEEAQKQVEEAATSNAASNERKRPLDQSQGSTSESPARKIKRIDLDDDDEIIML